MNHLVLGGTGTVGSAVVQGLLAKGQTVRVLTRSEEKSKALPSGATGVVGDLTNPLTYDAIFKGSDSLFLLTANSITETFEALSALHEAKKLKYKKIVYLSVHFPDWGRHVAHFGAKENIEHAIKESGIPYTILQPNNFYQNDYWFKDPILQYGVYPQPIGDAGISRVDIRDIGDAAVNAMITDNHTNKTYALVGPEAVTGKSTAEVYSRLLGKEIKYGGHDMDAWYEQWKQWIPVWMAYEFRIMYELFQTRGLKATPAQLKETETVLGHAPRRFEDFAKEMMGK
ncbi:MAG: NmrA family NAD(P)-binding protein [bacterium]|nr:NmrA family NAD(P)-binding protein [bacterium]